MHSYPLGEMLINYSCGFIRRGLLGTVILKFTGIFGLNPLVFYKILCGIAYIATYVFIIIKLRKNKYFLFVVRSTTSPAPSTVSEYVLSGYGRLRTRHWNAAAVSCRRNTGWPGKWGWG